MLATRKKTRGRGTKAQRHKEAKGQQEKAKATALLQKAKQDAAQIEPRCYTSRGGRNGKQGMERVFFVRNDCISGRNAWGTFYREPSGALARLKSPTLGMQRYRADAQADLDNFAKKHGLPRASLNQERDITGYSSLSDPQKRGTRTPAASTALIVPPKNGEAILLAPKLNVNERKRLAGLERTIAANLQSFHDLGCAMIEIRDRKLYREGFPTFESYCKARWDFGRQYAYRLIDSAKVVDDLSPIGDKKLPLPANESQARPLAKVDPDQRVEVWREVLKRADKQAGGRVTTALVEETAKQWITPGDVLDDEATRRAEKKASSRGGAQTPRDCVPGEAPQMLYSNPEIPRRLLERGRQYPDPLEWNGKKRWYAVALADLETQLQRFAHQGADDADFLNDLYLLLDGYLHSVSGMIDAAESAGIISKPAKRKAR